MTFTVRPRGRGRRRLFPPSIERILSIPIPSTKSDPFIHIHLHLHIPIIVHANVVTLLLRLRLLLLLLAVHCEPSKASHRRHLRPRHVGFVQWVAAESAFAVVGAGAGG
jgi:hypothetical protein